MTLRRAMFWFGGTVVAAVLMAALWIALFGWNWLRAPIERQVLQSTGRSLVIGADLTVRLGWPALQLASGPVSFANPPWAQQAQMLTADAVQLTLAVLPLLRGELVMPKVHLLRPTLFLERSPDGRKTWLLDREQRDESARLRVNLLTIDTGTLGYDDLAQHTRLLADLSTDGTMPSQPKEAGGLQFRVRGRYKGLVTSAQGSSGPVLALREETTPYPLQVVASVGRTRVQAEGTVTNLLDLGALDMQLALQGASLEDLFPILGIALPATGAYTTKGHLIHHTKVWRYEQFSGRIGASDIAGMLSVQTGTGKPELRAVLSSKVLDLDDLGPVIGARPGSVLQARQETAPSGARVLPDLPFNSARWDSVDAEVTLNANTIRRARALPLERLQTKLVLRDSVLTLDPLEFGVAGGILKGAVTLDGGKKPIRGRAKFNARKLQLARLFPTLDLGSNSVGQINGDFDLSGNGNSVGAMLGQADGNLTLVVADGQISKLLLEKAGLHLWEILQLNLTGDRLVKLRCAVADFQVARGRMQVDSLVLDTAVTTIHGSGSIDLARETLDLTLRPTTKNTSPLALRSPIHVGGSFAKPDVSVDTAPVAARALGAIALGIVNPLLALLPLIDSGPGKDSDCGQLVRQARLLQPAAKARAASTP